MSMAMAQGMIVQDALSQPEKTLNSASEALMQDEIEAMDMEKQLKNT
jgi:hypothetical protein